MNLVKFISILFLGIITAQETCKGSASFIPWRCSENGGINALYVYLHVNGVACEYSNMLAEKDSELDSDKSTALSIKHISAKNGLPLRPVKLTWDELLSSSKPIIVYADGNTPEQGAYLLLFAMQNEKIDYMDGSSATINKMSYEELRRVWSRVAFVPDTVASLKRIAYFAAGLSLGFALPTILVCLVFRRAKKSG